MIVLKWYYGIVSKRLIDSYIFFTKGHHALYGDERFYNLFNFKMVKLFKLFASRFDSEHRLMTAKNKIKKTVYY